MRRILTLFVVFMALLSCATSSLAHSGRTDSSGGHRDNKNKSGLGSYHYHHGYGPHLHPGGVCPYSSSAPSTSGSKSSGSSSPKPVKPDESKTDFEILYAPDKLEVENSVSLDIYISSETGADRTISWKSNDESVAIVSPNGVVSAISSGNTSITGTLKNGISHSIKLTVYDILPERILTNINDLALILGDETNIDATVEPLNVRDKTLVWTSSDPDIVSVDEMGHIVAKEVGNAVITISCQMISVDIPVDVRYIMARVLLFEENSIPDRLDINETVSPLVLFEPEDATYQDIVLTSSDTDVLEVDGPVIRAVGAGVATITATSKDSSVSTDVKVRDPNDIKVLIGVLCVPGLLLIFTISKRAYDYRKRQAENQ